MSLMDPVKEANRALGDKVCKSLLSRGFKSARYAENGTNAGEMARALIPDGCSVGIPGTVTVRQLGLVESLLNKGCTVYHHWDPTLGANDKNRRLADENAADWFVTSANALSINGMIVNIDGTGNRVAGMAWSPGKILYIVGVNKIADNLEAAIARARSASAPNALRIGLINPPCTKTGHCVDCDSPERVCRVLTIMERVPLGREAHIIIAGESLGY